LAKALGSNVSLLPLVDVDTDILAAFFGLYTVSTTPPSCPALDDTHEGKIASTVVKTASSPVTS
jgi:hypothetical protein